MSEQVTILSVTANTPVDIYYCDSTSGSCVYVSTVATFPYVFDVPEPYDENDFVIKIVDTKGYEIGYTEAILPTGTPNPTPTSTITPTQTPTLTNTPTLTPSKTPNPTPTPSLTPTNTPTVSVTSNVSPHLIGQGCTDRTWPTSGESCRDTMTIQSFYTYISAANLIPVIGAIVYTVENNSVLYSPFNGGDNWLLMKFGSSFYSVQIDSSGKIIDFVLCY